VADLAGRRTNWPGGAGAAGDLLHRALDGASNPSGQADQDVYLKALLATGSVDRIEYGTYVARIKTAPLAIKDTRAGPNSSGQPGQ
jgi:hypothetical protein